MDIGIVRRFLDAQDTKRNRLLVLLSIVIPESFDTLVDLTVSKAKNLLFEHKGSPFIKIAAQLFHAYKAEEHLKDSDFLFESRKRTGKGKFPVTAKQGWRILKKSVNHAIGKIDGAIRAIRRVFKLKVGAPIPKTLEAPDYLTLSDMPPEWLTIAPLPVIAPKVRLR